MKIKITDLVLVNRVDKRVLTSPGIASWLTWPIRGSELLLTGVVIMLRRTGTDLQLIKKNFYII